MRCQQLTLLGGFEACLASGARVEVPTRKARALLAYIALHPGQALPRERLGSLLWGDSGDERAQGNLRQTLMVLRKALDVMEPSPLQSDRGTVALDPACIEVDAVSFARLAVNGNPADLEAAVALYRGDLLEGFSIPDPAFESWLEEERRHLRELMSRALMALVAHKRETGDPQAAVTLAHRLLTMDPLQERAHRALMVLYGELGEREAALQQYHRCRELLADELGVAPDAETEAVYQALRGDHPTPAGRADISAAEAGERETVAAAPLPDKPSIAVLPFVNMSGDAEQEYFSDGVTEDIITGLSRFRELFVIARNSSFSYKGKAVKVQDIATDLGARYVLEGSVRASRDRIRVTAQLIDAETGHHIWSERYNREITDLFAFQDETAQTVAGSVAGRLKLTAEDRAKRKAIESLDAYDYTLRGQSIVAHTKDDNLRARQAYEKAIELDPTFTRAYVGLALSYAIERMSRWWDPADSPLDHALEHAAKAISLDNTDSKAQVILGLVYEERGEYEEAKVHLERALELNPSNADAFVYMGILLQVTHKPRKAIDCYLKAMRLNPYYPAWYVWRLGSAYNATRRYENALISLKEALNRNPKLKRARLELAATYARLDRIEEAGRQVEQLLAYHPDASIRQELQWTPGSKEKGEDWLELLRRVGLPE